MPNVHWEILQLGRSDGRERRRAKKNYWRQLRIWRQKCNTTLSLSLPPLPSQATLLQKSEIDALLALFLKFSHFSFAPSSPSLSFACLGHFCSRSDLRRLRGGGRERGKRARSCGDCYHLSSLKMTLCVAEFSATSSHSNL